MKIQDCNNLAGQLIEYGMELTQREVEATKKADFETLKKICELKAHIHAVLEALDNE